MTTYKHMKNPQEQAQSEMALPPCKSRLAVKTSDLVLFS